MQFPKEEIRQGILLAAREEFMKNGFENASIRRITSAAKTSKSNVYNYFCNKDALFRAVVEPALAELNVVFEGFREKNSNNNAASYSMLAQKDAIYTIMQMVSKCQDEFRLLFFSSAGSSLASFKDDMASGLADVLADWVAHVAPDKGISDFFIQSIARFYIDTIGLVIFHRIPRSLNWTSRSRKTPRSQDIRRRGSKSQIISFS